MARPSAGLDRALLASGRVLFPAVGCAGLSVRAVAEHAGVNPAMFHYHFGSKDEFLRTLLQQAYEEMFASFAGRVQVEGPAIERLRMALTALAHFARRNRQVLARVWMDAIAGEAVALAFFRSNGPRHIGVLFALLEQAHAEGALAELPPLQRFAYTMGAVLLPIVFVAGLVEAVALPALGLAAYEAQVLSDAAIAERIDRALAALAAPGDKQAEVVAVAAAAKAAKAKVTSKASKARPPRPMAVRRRGVPK